MRIAAVRLFLIFFIVTAVFADSSSEAVLVPRDVDVGGVAELTFFADIGKSDIPDGESLVLSEDAVPSSEQFSIERITVTPGESAAEVRIIFVPWVTGRLRFPAITIEDSVVHPPEVSIVSILETTGKTALEPARSPLLVPGTTWLIYGSLLGALFVVVFFWVAVSKLRRWFLMNPGRRVATKRSRRFIRQLRLLGKKRKHMEFEWWYARLSAALKQYLFLYFTGRDTGFLSFTGTEIANFQESADHGQMIRDLFEVIDRVRFSGSEQGVSRSDLLESAEALSRILEENASDDIS